MGNDGWGGDGEGGGRLNYFLGLVVCGEDDEGGRLGDFIHFWQ